MLSPHPIFGDDDNPIVYFKRNPAQNQDNHWTPCQPHEAVACTTPAYDGEVSDLPRKVQDGILVGHIAYCLPGMDVFFTCCPYEPTAIVFFPEVKGGACNFDRFRKATTADSVADVVLSAIWAINSVRMEVNRK